MLKAETAPVETAPAPSESHNNEFRADIQGLRAIAVLGVMAFHAGVPGIGGGFVGVDVFYVISGFLITGLMLRDEKKSSGPRQLLEFYARRVRRILPASAVVLVATLAGAAIVENGIETVRAGSDAQAATFFVSNVRFVGSSAYFAHNTASRFQQYWSLSVEEQFYAIWPLLFFVIGLVFVRRRRVATAAVVLALCLASFALSVYWTSDDTWTSLRSTAAFYLLTARAWELGIGVLLALGATRVGRLPARFRAPLAWLGLAAIVASMLLYDQKTTFPGWTALLPTLGTAAVIAAGISHRRGDASERVLSSRASQEIGRYSYSLYLWHWPVLLLIARHVHVLGDSWISHLFWMTVLSVPAAVVTYHVVENPVRRAKALRGRPVRSLGLGVAIVAVSLVAVAVTKEYGYSRSHAGRAVATSPVGATPEIVATNFVPKNLTPNLIAAANKQYVPKGCGHHCTVVAPASGKPTVAIFGDSHAEHLIPGMARAMRSMGVGLDQHTFDGCSWFDNIGDRLKNETCDNWRRDSISRMKQDPPALIILSSRVDRSAATTAAWSASIARTMAALPASSQRVIVSETPISDINIAQCLADHLRATLRCDQKWPDEFNARLVALAQQGGAAFLDLRPALCNERRCPAITQNHLIWRDDDHITLRYSASLHKWMRAQIEPLLAGS